MTPLKVLVHKRNEYKNQVSKLIEKRYQNDTSVGNDYVDSQIKLEIESLSRLIYKCNKSIKYLKRK